jgi:hypothetical protein
MEVKRDKVSFDGYDVGVCTRPRNLEKLNRNSKVSEFTTQTEYMISMVRLPRRWLE